MDPKNGVLEFSVFIARHSHRRSLAGIREAVAPLPNAGRAELPQTIRHHLS